VEFRALGDLEVVEDGRALALGPHQQRAVLALLVLSAGEVVSSDWLIEALWGECPPPTAAKTVQVYISRLRKTLDGAPASSSGGVIVTVDHGYMLRVDPGQVDVRAFERLLDRGRDAFADREFDAAATVLRQALGLWRGAPLADFTFDAFAAADIARLQELRLEALEIRIDADLALGRHAALVAELETLTTEHPLRERLRAARMLALYRCGREPEALTLYRETRGLLVDELGMEPSPALRELHDAILRQDPALKAPATSGLRPTAGSEPRVRRRRRAALVAATLALAGGVALVIALLAPGGGPSVDVAANFVAVIDPGSRRLLGDVAVGARPGPLAEADGSVWVANLDDNTITGIAATSRKRGATFTPGGPISDMTAAGNSLWISEAGAGVTNWDPTVNGRAKETPLRPYDAAGPQSVDAPQPVAVDGSSLWVGQYGAVTRYDTTGTRRPALIQGVDNVDAIAVGAGATWVSDTSNDVVSKIEGDRVVGNPITTGDGPGALAVGDGAVWVAERFDNKVARIDPAADRVSTDIPVGAAPSAVAVIGHSVWVANSGDGTLFEIDARSNRVVHRLRIGNSPTALAVIDGRLWVSVQAPAASVASPLAAPAGGVARVAFKDDPGSLDPALATSAASWQILNATCAKLYNYPDASGAAASRIIAEVARGMPAVSEDGLRYTFTIRPGFRFSPPSKAPVTAETFREVIERTLSPRWRPPPIDPSDVPAIAGLRAYQSRQARHLSGVRASGDRLVIRLTRPDAALPQRLALPFFCAVPDNAPVRENDTLPMAGPYYASSYSPGKQIVLARNPNYRGHRPAHLNTIDITVGERPATSIARVIAGTEDYYDAPAESPGVMSVTEEARLRTRYGAARGAAHPRFFENPSTIVQYLVFNTARGPFVNPRLRRAVNFALDRDAIAAEPSAGGVQRPTDQYLAPGLPGFRDATIYPLGGDPARARRLAGRRHHHAVLIVDKNSPYLQRAQIVQSNLAKIGIDVDIQALSVREKFKREAHADANWDLASTGWRPDIPDPSNVLNPLLRGNHLPPALNQNYAHFDDPAYNRRLDAAARLIGPARYTTYANLDNDLAEKAAPMAAIGVWLNRDLLSARIGCPIYQPIYGIDLAALCLRKA
jgi:ABC-type oligopeptide transport system substrate-binding subunit/DNA-binding SARP family transcriptional activator/streptogramin lyase